MVEYILGNYMISKNKISKEQLGTVLEKQDQVRVKLGLIAVSEGMITSQQAEEINRLQTTFDKRFGDIAVEMKYMTSEQLDKILKMQGNAYLVFTQSLVDEGILKVGEMESILEGFRKENGYGLSDVEALKNDDVDKILSMYVPQDAEEFGDIIGVAARAVIRCIDRHVYLEKAEIVSSVEGVNLVSQSMAGDKPMVSGFVEIDGGMLNMASVYGRDEFNAVDDDVLDAAAEFLNCINGLYAAFMSGKGVGVELLPPQYFAKDGKITGEKVCRIPLCIQGKKLYFIAAR